MKYFREKKVRFGDDFLDVDLFETDDSYDPPAKKAKRKRISPPHIIAANERNSRNQLRQLVVHNFRDGDYYVTTTYAQPPPSISEAQREISNYISRLKRLYARYGQEFRAVYVTEGGREKTEKEGGGITRIHHHLCIPGGVPREEVERCWKGKKESNRGFCNCSMIQSGKDERGCEKIAEYLAKSRTKTAGKGVRRWNATRNIKRPIETIIDNKFSRRRTEEMIELVRAKQAVKYEQAEQLRRILEKRYDREIADISSMINPITGRVYISARFKKRE